MPGMGGMMGMPPQPMGGLGGMPGQPGPTMPAMPVQPSVIAPQHTGSATPVPAPAPAPAQQVEWSIPQAKRVSAMAQFQAHDKAKTGFLAAVQAKGVLLGTGLPQQTLATVWNLADIDKDGRLSCEEFILALHLCDLCAKGEPLPSSLPLHMVPPSLRRQVAGQQQGGSTPGSNSGRGSNVGVAQQQQEPLSPASFEDKRRENWEAGAAELNKRRASLLEQQKREKEERERKEKEEKEQREKQKREAEARRLAEIENRRAREEQQRREREEQLRRQEEQREQARKELEKQRLAEWEKSRKSELEAHMQRETEKVINLRAKKESLAGELEGLKSKIESLSTGIADTRTGVTDVKSFIDGMRSSRDTKMGELNGLKSQLKEQNQRLLQVTQEKARLESKNKINQQKLEEGRVVELTDFDLKKAEKLEVVERLREEVKVVREEEERKRAELETNKAVLASHREKLTAMIETCKALHQGFDEKRREVRAEKRKRIEEITNPNFAWGAEGAESPSFDEPAAVTAAAVNSFDQQNSFDRQNTFETQNTFDRQNTFDSQNAFDQPAASFDKANSFDVDPFASSAVPAPGGEPEANESPAVCGEAGAVDAQPASLATGYVQYRALYDYAAQNSDELAFSCGDIILVHPGQDHEPGWLGGELRGKVGWFPEAFAELVTPGGEGAASQASALQPIQEVPENGSDSSSFQEVSSLAPSGVSEPEPAAVAAEPTSASAPNPCSEDWVAVYPYSSEEPGDLVFEAGELIRVVGKNGDWWTGHIGDRQGVFPFNYVEPAGEAAGAAVAAEASQPEMQQEAGEQLETQAEETEDKSGKKLELATVLAAYEASSKEQLSLAKGQMVIVRKKTETGWWQGELQAGGKGKKRAVGWFPASYVKLLSGDAGGGAGQEKEAEQSTISGGEKYVALFPYTAQYEDELSFEAGDAVMVLAKDEEAWWRGEARGKQGVFPSNYVEPAQ